ncbi:MAG: site-specific DNA-methyltransferase [Ignavibacteriae bacterium]|nr:site-specific DNA-methyltransferase [Ignavibacteriota bacterium]
MISKAQNFDEELISLLLEDKELKAKFFLKVKDVLVFNQSLFIQFLEQKNYLNDSYTAYKNKVGLNIDGKFLKQRNEVSLVWPFKDCVLEGGQSREEDKREEIFFNETLAQDEINQLLEPKVLTNGKRCTAKGEKPLDKFTRNDKGVITNNLIIKGNNLLALHSLKEEFAGKVKLIYIDPPYNTGKDGFNYNDNFNHSSWLTFMKNRLDIARDLLINNGAIFISLDDKEVHYCKVLLDDIFGRENFLVNIIWKKRGGAPNDRVIGSIHENILVYTKDISNIVLYKRNRSKKQLNRYSNPDNHPKGNWAVDNLMANVKGGRYVESLYFPIVNPNTGEEHYPSSNGNWRFNKDKIDKLTRQDEIYFGVDGKGRPKLKRFLCDVSVGVPYSSIWDDISHNNLATSEILKLFGSVNTFDTPKPEDLIQQIINLCSIENDIVLDFHLGSGTTSAVAHKMKRQYIGIEQMDYIETIAVERLKKVIKGEQGGISGSVNWKGGGEFVYLELKKYNQIFIEQIESAKNTKALLKIWENMKAKSFLNYNVDIKMQDKHIEEFKALTLAEQKQHLAEILDKNQLYVNLFSLNDKDFAVTQEEKKVTKEFYQI